MAAHRDIKVDFLRGCCLPLMMIEHLRIGWIQGLMSQPVGFFSAMTAFLMLSGLATVRAYDDASKALRWALRTYALYVTASMAAVALARYTHLGREIEIAATSPWQALWHAVLLQPGIPMLEVLPMYAALLAATPLVMRAFERGWHRQVLALSMGVWVFGQFEMRWTGAQFLFITGLYAGHAAIRPPRGIRGLNLGLFGLLVGLGILRHSGLVPQSPAGPLAVVNLYLMGAFLWLVPEPLRRLAKQGRLFIQAGGNAVAVCAWMILIFYALMIWFPQMNQLPRMQQALLANFAVAWLLIPVAIVHPYLSRGAAAGAFRASES